MAGLGAQENNMNIIQFQKELTGLINKHSLENESNIPDFIISQFLIDCLLSFNTSYKSNEKWNGRESLSNINPPQINKDNDSTERGKGGFGSNDKKELNTLLAGMEQPTMENIESPIDKGSTIAKLYKESGGIPIKRRYADEIKKRED